VIPTRIIKFSREYSKLNYPLFTTIRRYDKYDVNEEYLVKTPERIFRAFLFFKTKIKLKDIPTRLLIYDTGALCRAEAEGLLSDFYKNPISPREELTILFFIKNKEGGI